MKLSDVMSHMELATYPEIAMVIFLVVFAAVAYRLLRLNPGQRAALDRAAQLPLASEAPLAEPTAGTHAAEGSETP